MDNPQRRVNQIDLEEPGNHLSTFDAEISELDNLSSVNGLPKGKKKKKKTKKKRQSVAVLEQLQTQIDKINDEVEKEIGITMIG